MVWNALPVTGKHPTAMMQAEKLLSQNNHKLDSTTKLRTHFRGPPQPAHADGRVFLVVSVQEHTHSRTHAQECEATKACSVVGHNYMHTLIYLCLCRKRMKPRKQPSVLKPCKQVRPCHRHSLLRSPSLCVSLRACAGVHACVHSDTLVCAHGHTWMMM